jgi:hypothetical protein
MTVSCTHSRVISSHHPARIHSLLPAPEEPRRFTPTPGSKSTRLLPSRGDCRGDWRWGKCGLRAGDGVSSDMARPFKGALREGLASISQRVRRRGTESGLAGLLWWCFLCPAAREWGGTRHHLTTPALKAVPNKSAAGVGQRVLLPAAPKPASPPPSPIT